MEFVKLNKLLFLMNILPFDIVFFLTTAQLFRDTAIAWECRHLFVAPIVEFNPHP